MTDPEPDERLVQIKCSKGPLKRAGKIQIQIINQMAETRYGENSEQRTRMSYGDLGPGPGAELPENTEEDFPHRIN